MAKWLAAFAAGACGRKWRIASFRSAAEFGRYRGIAGTNQAAPITLDYEYVP
jgi:hypothetical protein